MTDASQPRPLRAVVGEGVRRIREDAGLRQDEVAIAARRHGLAWNRGRIATLEHGQKAISAEELCLIPSVLAEACRRPVSLGELIGPDAQIPLSETVTVDGRTLAAILGGAPVRLPLTMAEIPAASPPIGTEVGPGMFVIGLPEPRVQVGPFTLQRGDLERWLQEAGETEMNAARRLDRTIAEVVTGSHYYFNHAFATARDLRASALYEVDASPDRRRAIRGQVTRRMFDELRDYLQRCEAAAAKGEPLPSGLPIHDQPDAMSEWTTPWPGDLNGPHVEPGSPSGGQDADEDPDGGEDGMPL